MQDEVQKDSVESGYCKRVVKISITSLSLPSISDKAAMLLRGLKVYFKIRSPDLPKFSLLGVPYRMRLCEIIIFDIF